MPWSAKLIGFGMVSALVIGLTALAAANYYITLADAERLADLEMSSANMIFTRLKV